MSKFEEHPEVLPHMAWGAQLVGPRLANPRPSELIFHLMKKGQTLSGLSKEGQGLARLRQLAGRFPLHWSHYVRLLAVSNGDNAEH